MSNTSVSIKDLSLSFGAVSVLQNLDLDVADGEFVVLLGSSGCGKSTLLNCIAGLLEPTDGQIFIKGKNVTWEEPKDRGIGMVFQSYALYPQMTVRKNLSFGLQVAGFAKAEIDKAAEDFLRHCFGLQVDFDIQDALGKLERLGLVRREGDAAYAAIAPTEALARLDAAWDGLFHFSARR